MGPSVALLLFLVASETAFCEDQDMSSLTKIINTLGTDDLRKAAAKDDGNFLISPVNLAIAFGMIYDGIGGKTADERRNPFGYEEVGLADNKTRAAFRRLTETFFELSESKEYVMHYTTAVLINKNYPIVQTHKNLLLQNYISTAVDVDFQKGDVKTIQEIKDCVKFKTNTQIETPRVDLDLLPNMVMFNAGCFQGTWKTECGPKDTTETVFYNKCSSREKTKVKMIHFEGEFLSARLDEGTVLELPLKGDVISLIVHLPDSLTAACEAEQKLQVSYALAALKQAKKYRLNVSFPILNLEHSTTLSGLPATENSSDLKGTPGNTFVSRVFRKIFIKIDEKGFETSGFAEVVAGTRIGGGGLTIEPKAFAEANEKGSELPTLTRMKRETRTEDEIKNLVFDRPFFLHMLDLKNNFVYFVGRVSDLSK